MALFLAFPLAFIFYRAAYLPIGCYGCPKQILFDEIWSCEYSPHFLSRKGDFDRGLRQDCFIDRHQKSSVEYGGWNPIFTALGNGVIIYKDE